MQLSPTHSVNFSSASIGAANRIHQQWTTYESTLSALCCGITDGKKQTSHHYQVRHHDHEQNYDQSYHHSIDVMNDLSLQSHSMATALPLLSTSAAVPFTASSHHHHHHPHHAYRPRQGFVQTKPTSLDHEMPPPPPRLQQEMNQNPPQPQSQSQSQYISILGSPEPQPQILNVDMSVVSDVQPVKLHLYKAQPNLHNDNGNDNDNDNEDDSIDSSPSTNPTTSNDNEFTTTMLQSLTSSEKDTIILALQQKNGQLRRKYKSNIKKIEFEFVNIQVAAEDSLREKEEEVEEGRRCLEQCLKKLEASHIRELKLRGL